MAQPDLTQPDGMQATGLPEPLAIDQLNPVTRDALLQVSTATLATQLFSRGFRQQFLVGVTPLGAVTRRWVGTAFTLRFIPAREDLETLATLRTPQNLQWAAVESLQAGHVLMIDSNGRTDAASAGDMLVMRAMRRGAVGVVTDGAFRDGSVIAELDIPAYARANTATTRLSRFHVADMQVPIGCGGVAVYPGDVVVGDADGVIVIPRHIATEIAQPALEQERLEEYLHGRVRAGEELWGVYPPNEQTLAEYDAWRSSNAK
jgi:regulator of RNase E activity RraA